MWARRTKSGQIREDRRTLDSSGLGEIFPVSVAQSRPKSRGLRPSKWTSLRNKQVNKKDARSGKHMSKTKLLWKDNEGLMWYIVIQTWYESNVATNSPTPDITSDKVWLSDMLITSIKVITGQSWTLIIGGKKKCLKIDYLHIHIYTAQFLDHLLQTISETCLLYIKTATWLKIAAEITPRYPHSWNTVSSFYGKAKH